MDIDPGARRRQSSACKCLVWTALSLLLVFALAVCWFIVLILLNLSARATNPHKALQQNQTWAEVLNKSDVVRPLIDRNQSFDIAVSVWLRMSPEDEEQYKSLHPERLIAFDPLYSDIAFRNVHLTDKGVRTTVNFTLPTERFKRINVSQADLHGTFVLLPSKPSPLDYLKNYSHWVPENVVASHWPRHAWPFPLGSSFTRERDLADDAVEAFSIAISLLEFHEVSSRCKQSDPDTDNLDDDDVIRHLNDIKNFAEALGIKPPHKAHPHVVTRTQLRLVDDTPILSREAYDKAHNTLKKTSCGQRLGLEPSQIYCQRSGYFDGGPIETRLELSVPTSDGENRTEWAYAPYMDVYAHAAGPMDRTPIPINRENCTEYLDPEKGYFNDSDTIDISWHISFSGRTPAKYLLTNAFSWEHPVNNSLSEYEKVMAQNQAELWNGLRGHRFYEDAHPRRRFFIEHGSTALIFVILPLDFFYWYTLPTTVGVSIVGTYLLILYMIGESVIGMRSMNLISADSDYVDWILASVISMVISGPVIMVLLKGILRIQVEWHPRWKYIPIPKMVKANHQERASQRLDRKSSWVQIVGCILVLTTLYAIFKPGDRLLISALHPTPPVDDSDFVSEAIGTITSSLYLTAVGLQLIMNHRSHTFAGSYKLAAYLRWASSLFTIMWFIPSIIGRFDARGGLDYSGIIDAAVVWINAWQALRLPSVKVAEDEDAE